MQVDHPVPHRSPKPLDEHVVPPRALAVHADRNADLNEDAGEGRARELRASICIADLRLPLPGERFLKPRCRTRPSL